MKPAAVIHKTVSIISGTLLKTWKVILALLCVLFAVLFFKAEQKELADIVPHLTTANPLWMMVAGCITFVYVFFQSGIYKKSFAAFRLQLSWAHAALLFLTRNFISVFLPAGAVSSLAYTPQQVRKLGYKPAQLHQAGGLFAFTGLVTVFIVGLPVMLLAAAKTGRLNNAWLGLAFVFFLTALILFLFFAIRKKGTLHKKLTGYFPALAEVLDENTSVSIHQPSFIKGLLFSTAVEVSGILHVYLAMLALGSTASVTAAAVTYIAAVVMMIASPFLKGLGVVELSMMYVLHQFGYTTVTALSITILYRVFEFWLPLAMGLFVFVWKSRHFILRSMPAVFTFSLAVINITSAVTAPLHERFHLLRAYLPLTALHASAMMVLLFGLLLFVTSVFLFKGFRSAWIIAVIAAAASLVGHLTKALDYEEAVFAFFTLLILLATYRQYRMRSDAGWRKKGLLLTFSVLVSVLLFGFISFYFIDVKHFGIDFTWQQSLLHTFKSFLLIDDASIQPLTHFGLEFIWLIRCVGFSTWLFLFWSLIQPHVSRYTETDLQRMKAKDLLKKYGHSAVDYFKVYPDKLLFFSSHYDAFVSYRIANGFAVVLEEPVSAVNQKVSVLKEFEHYCRKAGLKPAFYRVDAGSIHWFDELRKKRLLIGQEAVLDVTTFSLEGKERKSLRNGISNLQKKGYTAKLYEAPLNEHFVQALKKVSDEWLMEFGKSETVFSQGMFDANEIRQQDIITLENEKGEINAFLNIVPDYSAYECTYDLIRKTKAAPGAAMDALILRLIDAAKAQQKKYINLGLVPMSGITQPQNRAEQLVKIAGDKIKTFQRYKGLREFKEKYASCWQNKYLVYDTEFDLLQLPVALNNVMKP